MMTSTFLDLGLSPAATGLPGAPPVVAAGAGVPDFASALTGLMAGTASAALATGVSASRQDLAAPGKIAPPESSPKVRMIADLPVCELLPPDIAPVAAEPDVAGDPTIKSEATDANEPELEPALAWLMPPVATPVAPPIALSLPSVSTTAAETKTDTSTPAATATPVSAVGQTAAPAISDPATTDPRTSTTPADIKLAVPLRQPEDRPDCEMPVGTAEPALAAPLPGSKPAEAQPVPPGVAGATFAPKSSGQSVEDAAPATVVPPAANAALVLLPTAKTQPLPAISVLQPASPEIAAAIAAVTSTSGLGGVKAPQTGGIKPPPATGTREPLASLSEARLRAATAQRLEIQPVALPGRDNGATLAAAAAIRAAPAILTVPIDSAASTSPASPLDAGIYAPIAAGAPAAAPVTAPQQTGIDVTRDPGLHHMIDRIEQLRDAFDARDTRIRLIPDALGPVDISVRRDAASDSVQVHFTAVEAGTRQLIADAQHRLVELADSRGVRIERATIENGSANSTGQQTWSGGDQSRPQQQAQTAQPPRAPARAAREAEPDSTDKRIA